MYVPVCVFLCLRVLKGIVGMKVNLLTCFSEIVVVNVYKWVCVCCLSPRLRLLLLLGCVCVCVCVCVCPFVSDSAGVRLLLCLPAEGASPKPRPVLEEERWRRGHTGA